MNLLFCVFAAVVAMQKPAPSPSGSGLKGTRYEFVMRVQMPERSSPGEMGDHRSLFPSEIRGQMWRAGASIRLEVKMGGSRDRVQILTPTALYTLMPSTKRGAKMALTRQAMRTMLAHGSPFALALPCDVKTLWPNAKKIGTEVAHGVECDVWVAVVTGGSPSTLRVWMPRAKKQASPVKVEITTPMGRRASPSSIGTSEQSRRIIELLKVSEGQAVPVSMFTIPQDYKITLERALPPTSRR